MKRVTAADVAVAAGVSKWTVARAFTPGASIAEASRQDVLREAARLGYRPNLLARGLATRTTQQVAVLVDDFANPYKLPMLEHLTLALQAEEIVALLININHRYGQVEALLNASQRQVDAAILLGTEFRDERFLDDAALRRGPPLFVLARESTIAAIPAVSCDAAISMREIGAHLWQRGYRRPGFLSGPRTLSTVLGRFRYFESFWNEHGVARVLDLPAGRYDRSAAAAAMRTYLAASPAGERIDVLMCENDALACGALDVARYEFGLRVPQDIAVLGYDGDALAATPAYDLTTYEQPMRDMVAALVAMLTGRQPSASMNLPGRLLVRGTT